MDTSVRKTINGKYLYGRKNTGSSYIIKRIDDENRTKAFKMNREISSDKELRIKLQEMIMESVFEGKSLIELLDKLNSDVQYSMYSNFFEGLINDQKNKKQELINRIQKEISLRKSKKEIIESIERDHYRWGRYKKYLNSLVDYVIQENERGLDGRNE